MVTTRSQSLRLPRPSYNKLQDVWGDPLESKGLSPLVPKGRQQAPRLQRSLSFRHQRGKPHPRCLETSSGLPEGLDSPPPEITAGNLGDTEQLIPGQTQGKQRIHQYKKQVDYALRRTWENFVANLPGLTLSRSTLPGRPQDSAS